MLGHLHGVGLPGQHPTSVDVGWQPCELRHDTDRVDGYELEAAEVCFLNGQQEFKQVYRGSFRQFSVMALLPEQTVVLRLRAYNRAGEGTWGDEIRLKAGPEELRELVEISGIPPSWRNLDLADLFEDDPNGLKSDRAASMAELMESLNSMVKLPPWQCPSSAPAPLQGAPGGSGQLGTPLVRPSPWAPSHRLGGSSERPSKSPIPLPFAVRPQQAQEGAEDLIPLLRAVRGEQCGGRQRGERRHVWLHSHRSRRQLGRHHGAA